MPNHIPVRLLPEVLWLWGLANGP